MATPPDSVRRAAAAAGVSLDGSGVQITPSSDNEPRVWRGYDGVWQVNDYPFAQGSPSIASGAPRHQIPYTVEYWQEMYGDSTGTRRWEPPERGPAQYDEDGNRVAGEHDPTETRTQALAKFFNLSGEEMARLRDIAERLGEDTDYASLKRLWGQLVDDASDAYSLGGKQVSVWQMGEMLASDWEEQASGEDGAGEEEDEYYGPVTETTTSFDITDPTTAWGMAYQAFSSELGRMPSKRQSRAFQRALRAYESANPRVTTTTVTPGPVDADGNPLDPSMAPDVTSTSTGGANPGMFLDSWLLENFGNEKEVRLVQGMGDELSSWLSTGL